MLLLDKPRRRKAERASIRVSRATLAGDSPSTHPARALRCKSGQVRVRVRVSRMQILLLFQRQGWMTGEQRQVSKRDTEIVRVIKDNNSKSTIPLFLDPVSESKWCIDGKYN